MPSDTQFVFMTREAAARMRALPFAYVLQWIGPAFPEGGMIQSRPIGSIQGGVVLSKEGERLGLCEWLMAFGDTNQRQLVVATDAQSVCNPDGSAAKQVEICEPPGRGKGSSQ